MVLNIIIYWVWPALDPTRLGLAHCQAQMWFLPLGPKFNLVHKILIYTCLILVELSFYLPVLNFIFVTF